LPQKILPKENIRLKIGVYDEDLKLKNKIYSFINIYYSLNDEEKIYDLILQDVYDNPRWYLDNFYYILLINI
jgi:hypothetical protein